MTSLLLLCSTPHYNFHTTLPYILQPHTQRPIMEESLVFEPRKKLSDENLFRLSLYYIYVTPETWQVASLLNQLHKLPKAIATQEVKATYLWMHDEEHAMWVRAKDMARKEPDELKRILRDEVGSSPEKWDVRVVRPVMAMAQLRLIKD